MNDHPNIQCGNASKMDHAKVNHTVGNSNCLLLFEIAIYLEITIPYLLCITICLSFYDVKLLLFKFKDVFFLSLTSSQKRCRMLSIRLWIEAWLAWIMRMIPSICWNSRPCHCMLIDSRNKLLRPEKCLPFENSWSEHRESSWSSIWA